MWDIILHRDNKAKITQLPLFILDSGNTPAFIDIQAVFASRGVAVGGGIPLQNLIFIQKFIKFSA